MSDNKISVRIVGLILIAIIFMTLLFTFTLLIEVYVFSGDCETVDCTLQFYFKDDTTVCGLYLTNESYKWCWGSDCTLPVYDWIREYSYNDTIGVMSMNSTCLLSKYDIEKSGYVCNLQTPINILGINQCLDDNFIILGLIVLLIVSCIFCSGLISWLYKFYNIFLEYQENKQKDKYTLIIQE